MKRKIIIFTIVFVLLIALAITIAGCSTSLSSVNGKYYKYENGQKVEDSYIELKAGKKWSDGEDSGEYTLDGNNITILLDGEELMSGTVKDGVLSLEFWGMTTVYYKDGAFGSESNNNDNSGDNGDNTGNGNTGNGDTPNTPAVPDEKAKILSIANGTVDGMTCNMEVNSSVSSVDLSGAITVSEDSSWQLYADVLGQTNIPTKYAANLSNGDNVYYIVVNSADGTVNRTYTLHIWKNFEVEILFKVDGETVKTLTKQTHTYIPQSEFSAAEKEGYTFIEWSNYEGKDYYISGYAGETYFLDYQIIFEAKFSANNYVITLDGNGGECNEKSKTVTYDQPFTLPVLSREGYTFRGWFYDYWNRLTLEDGESVADYNYDYDITATASWTVNSYLLTLSQEENNGTISGGGQKDYGSRVTITAKANNGYNFDGWYNNGKKVSSESTYTFTMPAENKTYTAKWEVDKELENFEFTSSNNGITITGLKNKNVTDVTIPDSVKTIESSAFSSCTSLTSIAVDENNQNYKSIDGNLYSKDGTILIKYAIGKTDTSFTIPDSVTTIGERAFKDCTSLTSITIPDSVTTIGNYAFLWCSNLTIYCEAESKPEGWDTYWNNDNHPVVWNVQSVFAQDGITYAITMANFATVGKYIGTATEVTIPSTVTIDGTTYTVTTIGQRAFYGCSNLTSITIPNSVTSIRNYAFEDCDNLTIYCEARSKPSGWNTGWNNDNRPVVWNVQSVFAQDGINYAITKANFATVGKYIGTATEVTIPSTVTIDGTTYTVTAIGARAFQNCTSLTTVTIPDSVTSIGSSAFNGCSGLTSITVPFVGAKVGVTSSDTSQYPFGYIFGTSSYTGGTAVRPTNLGTYYIPSSLRSVTVTGGNILYGAFWDCTNLTSITIPDSVTTIGNYAFYNCSNLTTITIPDSVTSIGSWAFQNCDSLESVTFGENSQLTTIGISAFGNCTSLTTVTIPDSVSSIGNGAFDDCDSLTSITIPESVTSIGYGAFYGCDSLTIYCEAESKPSGWEYYWNESNRPVVWGYKEE